MRSYYYAALALLSTPPSAAFVPHKSMKTFKQSNTNLNMVLEMPKKQISKLETLKVSSDHLIHPLLEVRTLRKKLHRAIMIADFMVRRLSVIG